MVKTPTFADLKERLFAHRNTNAFIYPALFVLLGFFILFFTRLNTNAVQKDTLIAFSLFTILQALWRKNTDNLSLLLLYLGFYLVLALYREVTLSLLWLMFLSGLITVFITAWQMHRRFPREVLWRHAYLVGLVALEMSAFFSFWIVFDDVFAKALLMTCIIYFLWGFLEADSGHAFGWRELSGYATICVLLVIVILGTIKPTFIGAISP